MKKAKPLNCPSCSSTKIIPILYGEPTMDAVKEARSRRIHLGGCCIMPDSPAWHCKDGEAEWGIYSEDE